MNTLEFAGSGCGMLFPHSICRLDILAAPITLHAVTSGLRRFNFSYEAVRHEMFKKGKEVVSKNYFEIF